MRSLAQVEESPWSEAQIEIRRIGQRLFREGGISLMQQVQEQIVLEDEQAATQVEIAWEGIGGWYR